MAVIYDMVSGKVISEGAESCTAAPPEHMPDRHVALQSIDESTATEDLPPVGAYMVMLQELLKKL